MSKLLGDLPRLFPRPEQTIAGIGRLLRQGEVSCVDVLNACLEQVDEWEPKVHAWVVLDREGAMAQARDRDEELRAGNDCGPLHGIPMGIKDIIDVKGLPTACGAKRWIDRVALEDAGPMETVRESGAVIMGKTVTTPYAWIDPPPTRNPWNLERTPGGSSSGSAAAVACGMCYGAIGTQTGGSITRPASFCGVAGMVSGDYGPCSGILPLAPNLDHQGPMARSVADLREIYKAMEKSSRILRKSRPTESRPIPPPRLLRMRGFFDQRADKAMLFAFERALGILADRGAHIVEIDDPVDFEQFLADHRTMLAAEAAEVHTESLDAFPDDYPSRITDLVLEGRSVPAVDYIRARRRQADSVHLLGASMLRYGDHDAIITPATVGVAPDRSTTGDPAFNSPWSFARKDTVSLPVSLAADGMPIAIQLATTLSFAGMLFRTARWCEKAIRSSTH